MTKLTCVCAWCGRRLPDIDGQGQTGVSHGLCEDCLVVILGSEGEKPSAPKPEAPCRQS